MGGGGLFHGPWIKLKGAGKDGGDEVVQVPQQAIDSGAVLVDEKTGSVTVKDPDALKKAAEAAEQAAKVSKEQQQEGKVGDGEKKKAGEKRKPKKLEVRSGKGKEASGGSEQQSKGEDKPKRKPPKLEVRSKSSSKTAA